MSEAFTLEPRTVKLTTRFATSVERTLPHKNLRMIGAWCFVDHFGPTRDVEAMSVAAHPHVGLQTATWLFSGAIEHRDSLGSVQVIHPGQLNLMTAGIGIAHSELSESANKHMHGVQLWIALPNEARGQQPDFTHYVELPVHQLNGMTTTVFIGELLGQLSPARTYSELVGAQIVLNHGSHHRIPIRTDFEHGVLVVAGSICINGEEIEQGSLRFLPAGLAHIDLSADSAATAMLLGGAPFQEKIVMWWNFIGRSHDEVVAMRMDWENQSSRFPQFTDRVGSHIPAPEMPAVRLQAR